MRHLVKYGSNPGVPTPKRGEAIAVLVEDVQTWPTLNEDGVSWDGNFVFKPGTGFLKVYMTPSTQKATLESSGSPDSYGSKGKFMGEYPGTPKEAMIWAKKHNSRGFVIFYGGCDSEEFKTMGTKCLPMVLQVSMEDNNEKNFMTLSFEQEMINDQFIRFYTGTVDSETPTEDVVAAEFSLAKAKGVIYQLPATAVTDDIAVTASDLDEDTVVSLIGGGGVAPLTLANQPTATVAVLLKDAATWTALAGAVINLKVVKADKTYLVEVSRS